MKKWECIVCGLIYDEAAGWPDDGIAPGTKWEDVPEDWCCPDCGVGKEDFELMEEASASGGVAAAPAGAEAPIVVVGSGMAGYGFLREFRKLDGATPVVVLTADDGAYYNKPLLSCGYTKNTDAEALAQSSAADMAQSAKADVRPDTRVVSIDTAKREIRYERTGSTGSIGDGQATRHSRASGNPQLSQSGAPEEALDSPSDSNERRGNDGDGRGGSAETLRYSKLVLAVGSQVIEPPIKGDGGERVFTVNSLQDYAVFRRAIAEREVKKLCIIGAGLIGCEFTNDLLNGGFQVETVDSLDYCLPALLPEAAGRAVQRGLESIGAKFHFDALVSEVNLRGDGVSAQLNNGAVIEADIVLSAVGVRPRVELARAAELKVNRGIETNRLLETSAKDVYALGDCAEVAGHVLVYVAPLMAAARALAKTLSGQPTEVVYPPMPVTIKTPACPVVVSPAAKGTDGEWQIEAAANNIKAEFRTPSGQLAAFALTGDTVKSKQALQKELPPILP